MRGEVGVLKVVPPARCTVVDVQRNAFDNQGTSTLSDVTVIVPTRNESANVEPLLDQLLQLQPASVIFVDDSDDDTPQVVDAAARSHASRQEASRQEASRQEASGRSPRGGTRTKKPRRGGDDRHRGGAGETDDEGRASGLIQLIHRPAGRREGGLGGAVREGLLAAATPWVAVIDGDLQHPPSVLVELRARAFDDDLDVVVASRYLSGGSNDGLGSRSRVALSELGTVFVRVLHPYALRQVTDPLSGCFLVRARAVDAASLRPVGFKILLELLLTTPSLRRAEVPYRFGERAHGESNARPVELFRLLVTALRRRDGTR